MPSSTRAAIAAPLRRFLRPALGQADGENDLLLGLLPAHVAGDPRRADERHIPIQAI